MLKRLVVIVAWIVATSATATITLAAVGRAGSEVSDRPAVPISSAELAARFASPTTTVADPGTTTTGTLVDPTVTTDEGAATTTSGATTTTVLAGTTTTAVTPTTSGSTTTTTSGSQNSTYEQSGVGRVTIRVSGTTVTYVSSVVLGNGYHVELEDGNKGPVKVIVRFEGESGDYTFTARFVGGVLEAGFTGGADD